MRTRTREPSPCPSEPTAGPPALAAQASRLTLFLLTAELGHSSRRESEELCSSLHTCHRKWRKEPPAGQVGTYQLTLPAGPVPTGKSTPLPPGLRLRWVETEPAQGLGDPGSNMWGH